MPHWLAYLLMLAGLALSVVGLPQYGIIPFALVIAVNGQHSKKGK